MSASAEDILAASEAGARGGNVVFCVGSVLRGDDAAGPLLAKRLEDDPVAGWLAVDGGQTPENDLGYLRRLAPQRLLLVDAAAMGLEPGAVRRLRAEDVAVQSLITTHTLPITYLLGELEQMCEEVTSSASSLGVPSSSIPCTRACWRPWSRCTPPLSRAAISSNTRL